MNAKVGVERGGASVGAQEQASRGSSVETERGLAERRDDGREKNVINRRDDDARTPRTEVKQLPNRVARGHERDASLGVDARLDPVLLREDDHLGQAREAQRHAHEELRAAHGVEAAPLAVWTLHERQTCQTT